MDLGERLGDGDGVAEWAVAHHGDERCTDGDDASTDGYGIAGEPVGVAEAVVALVV